MDKFIEYAEQLIMYRIRTSWMEISKLYNEIAAREGATLAMGFTLLTIHPEKGTPVTKIAPRMGMEPNSLSRLLNSMEKKGLISRKRDVEDKRKVYVCLTEAGREKRSFALEQVMALNEIILSDIEEEKVAAFFEVMEKVKTSVAKMREQFSQRARI
ncbi:MAG: MarR family transcriptional regulator [Bacteroidetes bacterium]|nr:MAG: MarR family transcriptional regulator [Bacteroidota bacterium]